MARRAMVFQLYHSKRLRHLHAKIDLAAEIHNHLIALQKRYYRRFKGYIAYYRLKRHVTKLKGMARFAPGLSEVLSSGEPPSADVSQALQVSFHYAVPDGLAL